MAKTLTIDNRTTFDKIKTRFEQMAGRRAVWDSVWKEIVEVCFPTGPRFEYLDLGNGRSYDPLWGETRAASRSRTIYDTTGTVALDRATAGVESLITPQGQQWHELAFDEPNARQPSLSEEQWMDDLANYLFGVRYDPRSGWLIAHQRALVSVLSLGTGVYFVEEAFGGRGRAEHQLPYRSVPIPLHEAYLTCNDQCEHDTCIRSFRLSASQALGKFGPDNLSDDVRERSTDPARMDQTNQYLHAVMPVEYLPGVKTNMPFASVYIDLDHNHVISESGFFEFPYVVYTWTQPSTEPYGEGPGMVALPDMKSLQRMSRDSLFASTLNIRPPMATAYDLDRPVNLNPGGINPKMIDPNTGRPLLAPVLPPSDPRLSEMTMETRRQAVRAAFYADLFAVLVDKPNMSATEAAIRAQEKGELLGPAASRIQTGLSRLVDRELSILARKGAFSEGSFLAPPNTVQGRDIGVKFISPIDRARQLPEVTGMQQTLEFAAGIAQFDPSVLDNFAPDQMLERARYLLGAPPLAQKEPEDRDAQRRARQQAEAAATSMAAGQQMVETAGGLGPAAEGLGAMAELAQNAGINPRQISGIPQG